MSRSDQIRRYLLSLRAGDGFAFVPQSRADLLSTCWVVHALALTGDLPTLAQTDRHSIASYIAAHQDPRTGHFAAPELDRSRTGRHDHSYLLAQLTDFSLGALDALDRKPDYNLSFLADYSDPHDVDRFLDSLPWVDPWYDSNRVMFVLSALLHEQIWGIDRAPSITAIIAWLDAHQDSSTGFWNPRGSASLHNQMAAAFHFCLFYTFLDRPLPRAERVINSTLILQQEDGLFCYAGGGGSCEDMDAIDLLCRASMSTDYRKHDVLAAIGAAKRGLWKAWNHDGGFCWARRNRFHLTRLVRGLNPALLIRAGRRDFFANLRARAANQKHVLLNPDRLTWCFSGIESMRIPLSSSDPWSTLARLIALALAETTFPDSESAPTFNWCFRHTPGIGYFRSPHNPVKKT